MRTKTAVAVGAAALVATGGTVWLVSGTDDSSTSSAAAVELATADVVRRDLVIYDETTATLGFTTSITVSSPVAGTVTSIAEAGTRVDPGTVVATVDGAPVVAMLGDVPAYRALSRGVTDGIDVRQLEANLVLLGFDPDGNIAVDEHFDSATAAAVTAWEDSLGLDGDGKVSQGEIAFVTGHLLVDSVTADVGGAVSSGGALLTGRQTERSFLVTVTGDDGGAVDHVAAADTAVATGTVLFWHAGRPVVAIEGDSATTPALTRDLSTASSNGVDVRLLEQMLAAGGFDPDGAMTVDDDFDVATAAAVQSWYASLGITVDSASVVVPAGSFVVVPAGLLTGQALLADPSAPAGDAVVMGLTTVSREVTTAAPIGDSTFALGATIEVEFPDGTVSDGTVVSVGNVAVNNTNVPGATPSVAITIRVDDIPASMDDYVQIAVTLRAVAESATDAFVVPVSALVALAEGGYALEVVDGSGPDAATHLIAVEPGIYSDGFVSVTGADVVEGLTVVVPS